jgi:hypothetical protein
MTNRHQYRKSSNLNSYTDKSCIKCGLPESHLVHQAELAPIDKFSMAQEMAKDWLKSKQLLAKPQTDIILNVLTEFIKERL